MSARENRLRYARECFRALQAAWPVPKPQALPEAWEACSFSTPRENRIRLRAYPGMDLFVGIDPGQTGALAAIDGALKVRLLAKAPDSAAGMADLVRKVRRAGPIRLAVLERTQAMPGNGVVAMHNYGRHAGAWEGVLAALRVPVTQPYPKVWQVLVRAPGCRRGDTKKRSIVSARRLFGVELKRSQDGMADALHMALWALRVCADGQPPAAPG